MPTNKNALLRYQILDRCFSNRYRKYTIEDLVDAVNEALYDMYGSEVSMRQIRDDIKYMRDRVSYNAPIEAVPFEGKRCYYRYSDPNYTIFNNELTTEEVTKLCSTINMLGRYRGGANRWLEEVISNLELRFGIKTNREHVVAFEQNEQLRGLEFLSELIWFLFGLEQTPNGDRIANRALDRIVKFSKANVPFVPNTSIDFSTRFDDVVGVTIPDDDVQKETVVLKFEPDRFPYVVSKPIHHSQKVLSEEDCILQIEVRPNKELESVIFSYFPHVEVLAPASLREEFKEKIASNLKKYTSVQNGRTDNI